MLSASGVFAFWCCVAATANGYDILVRTSEAFHYATAGKLSDCNKTVLFSCPDDTHVFNGRCTVKNVWLEKLPGGWFSAPSWLVLRALPEGIAASCPPGHLEGWTGYFVAYFDVLPFSFGNASRLGTDRCPHRPAEHRRHPNDTSRCFCQLPASNGRRYHCYPRGMPQGARRHGRCPPCHPVRRTGHRYCCYLSQGDARVQEAYLGEGE